MSEIGEMILTMVGAATILIVLRVAWLMAEPLAMMITKRFSGEMQWHRGTAKGRPPVRYVTDGWGRVVFMELDPEAEDTTQ